MVSDTVRTPYGPLVSQRYVTDIASYTARHGVMVGINDPFLRSMSPLAIIYRAIFKGYRLNIEIIYILLLKSALV